MTRHLCGIEPATSTLNQLDLRVGRGKHTNKVDS